MYMEGRIKAPGAQPSPGVNTASKRPGAEPTISGVSQVAFADVAGVDSGKQPSSAPGGPEKGPRPRESSEDGLLELRPREQMRPAGPGKKQSAPQEGPGELQAGREQAKPRSELGALPSRVPAAPERKQTAAQQGRQQNPGTVKGQVLQSHQQGPACQPSPGQQAANGPDIAQPVETSCILDSCGQRPGDKLPKRVDTPHIRPQEALLEPGPGGQKESPQEAMPLKDRAAPEENTADSFSPSTPGPEPLKGRVKTVETEPAPRPVPPPEVRDPVQKRLPEPTVAAGAQTLGNLRQGFMKCLLQVEEEEATRRRAAKARRSPRTLTPAPASAPQSLPPALPQSLALAPAMAPSWARAPAPRGSPGPASGPFAGLDTGWRRAEPWSGDRSLTGTKARQELEERGLFTLYQTWDERLERLEEQLTVRQEEAFRSYFEIFNGHGEVDAQSLGNILLLVGISLTPAQVEDALMSADVDGDGRVGFKDFLAVLTDTRRFFCSVEQNALADMAPPNPHTLFFEILSLLVEMLALPETALEEITNYYQKKLKEGTCKAREMELAIGRLRSRKKLPYNLQEADLEVPERRVLRILSRLKQQNYAANLQSPYAQVPCIPLCPRLDKKMVCRKQGSQYVLDPCTPASLGPDIHSLLFQSGSQGSREHGSQCRKWLSSVPARTH